jgi:hypothetical protein
MIRSTCTMTSGYSSLHQSQTAVPRHSSSEPSSPCTFAMRNRWCVPRVATFRVFCSRATLEHLQLVGGWVCEDGEGLGSGLFLGACPLDGLLLVLRSRGALALGDDGGCGDGEVCKEVAGVRSERLLGVLRGCDQRKRFYAHTS